MQNTFIKNQALPIILTFLIFGILVLILHGEISLLNKITSEDISLQIRWYDVLIGLTIYLKTSIDFAIFIGRLMNQNQGWKSRIAIEIGTAVGNALGTFIILAIWAFFKEVYILLGIMIIIASLVLFKLAEDSLEHITEKEDDFLKRVTLKILYVIKYLNSKFDFILKFVLPSTKTENKSNLSFVKLLLFSFTVPFILGLDDFAGYVPLFSIINVYGFAIGVLLGHMILNVLLYINPTLTIKIVLNRYISFIGGIAFILLAIWGMYEAIHLLT